MAGTSEILTICGIEIPAEERTPLVEALLRVMGELLETNRQLKRKVLQQGQRIEQLEEEIGRLKGLPEKPKHKPQPSPLNDSSGPPSSCGGKKRKRADGKRPGSAKRSKTRELTIHETLPLLLEDLPAGTTFIDYQDFTVQDLRVEPHNTQYRRGRYRRRSNAGDVCKTTSTGCS